MNTRMQAQTQVAPTHFFTPVSKGLLQRKYTCGNHTMAGEQCAECAKNKNGLQRKLMIGASNDPLELEADRVAEQVMRTPDPEVNGPRRDAGSPLVQRRTTIGGGVGVAEAPPIVHDVLDSSAHPLDAATRAFFEPRFGHDFSQVRVHTDERAVQSARNVNAHAYTVGHDIVFSAGKFSPATPDGRRLLAHELAHTIQQAGTGDRAVQREPDKDTGANQVPPNLVGCEKRKELVEQAVSGAESLAAAGIRALEREYPFTKEVAAMRAHFGSLGSAQKATIIERYKHVQSNVRAATITCAKTNKKVSAGDERVDLCGQASCPGSKITLYPTFGTQTCPAAPVLLHEALHNAGACDDIAQGSRGYPPSNAEENAYSYENFAVALTAAEKTPQFGKHRPSAPKVKD